MALADAIKVLEDGDFKTMGRVNYGSPTDYLTAHPKIDPVTGSSTLLSIVLINIIELIKPNICST
jgi:carotenoid cleavage dioxygenase-like enzyme